MSFEHSCLLAKFCSKARDKEYCNELCFPQTRLHGINGNGGLIAVANIPERFRTSTIETMPFKEQNSKAYELVLRYADNIVERVESGLGLYLFGVPTEGNPKGCGNGKTTAATAVAIEYLRQITILESKRERTIDGTPVLFIKMARFQNIYNSQFRGSRDTAESNGDKYQALKNKMMNCELLVLDDIGLRGATEALQNEVYEIIDERETNERTTIFTSNVPIERLSDILGEQVISRIEGMTFAIPFKGKDNRKRNL